MSQNEHGGAPAPSTTALTAEPGVTQPTAPETEPYKGGGCLHFIALGVIMITLLIGAVLIFGNFAK